MLGHIDLSGYLGGAYYSANTGAGEPNYNFGIDAVLLGGESGPHARPMNPTWARSVRDQCAIAGVPFCFKQNGEWVSVSEVAGAGNHFHFPTGETVRRVGKKKAGRTLDGRTHDDLPWDEKEAAQ
jgi:protein gp37